jgi:hypothetical protein
LNRTDFVPGAAFNISTVSYSREEYGFDNKVTPGGGIVSELKFRLATGNPEAGSLRSPGTPAVEMLQATIKI